MRVLGIDGMPVGEPYGWLKTHREEFVGRLECGDRQPPVRVGTPHAAISPAC